MEMMERAYRTIDYIIVNSSQIFALYGKHTKITLEKNGKNNEMHKMKHFSLQWHSTDGNNDPTDPRIPRLYSNY